MSRARYSTDSSITSRLDMPLFPSSPRTPARGSISPCPSPYPPPGRLVSRRDAASVVRRIRPFGPEPRQGLVDDRRRGPRRVREIHNTYTDLPELLLELAPLVGAVPVVADEHDVEAQLVPHLELVHVVLRDRGVDVLDAAHDLEP